MTDPAAPGTTPEPSGPATESGRPAPLCALLHQAVSPDAGAEEQDVLEQAEAIERALVALGWRVAVLPVTLDLGALAARLAELKPDLAFNLVECLPGVPSTGRMIAAPASLLDAMGIRYTGCGPLALGLTSDKRATKEKLAAAGLPTAPWLDAARETTHPGPFIVKSAWEHASFGIGPENVVRDEVAARALIAERARQSVGPWFAEAFIDGREFNLSLVEDAEGRPEVLPPAEMCFIDWPSEVPRILDFAGKWQPDHPLYARSVRNYRFEPEDAALLRQLGELARECWRVFGLAGYARVDFRVDAAGRPWILEINANPCLTPEMGLAAAATEAGIDFTALVARVVAAATRGSEPGAGAGADAAAEAPARIGARRPRRRLPRLVWRESVQPTDLGAVTALVAATGFFLPHEIAVAGELVEEKLGQGDASTYRFLFAETPDGRLMGYACYGPTPCTEGSWDLYWIAVHPKAQGLGLGRRLAAMIEARIAAEGGRRVYAETASKAQYAPTRAFYAALGYRLVATVADFYAAGDDKLVYLRIPAEPPAASAEAATSAAA
ncbi:MAG: GNAT family N-acetyltransferase [Alphaproteobacteria bacterium]|nr:GNAT family N-acetyltransferase [Alphaproteobacteria bacterium]